MGSKNTQHTTRMAISFCSVRQFCFQLSDMHYHHEWTYFRCHDSFFAFFMKNWEQIIFLTNNLFLFVCSSAGLKRLFHIISDVNLKYWEYRFNKVQKNFIKLAQIFLSLVRMFEEFVNNYSIGKVLREQ